MARQPLTRFLVGATSTWWLLAAGCADRPPYAGAFDLPIGAAVLQPEGGGPFEEPIGFVANGHGGRIVPLALKQGRVLTDDPTVSFLRTNYLATGASRRLSSIAVRTYGSDAVEVWAGDAHGSTLIRVPYVLDCTAEPDREECTQAVADAPVEQGVAFTVVQEPQNARLEAIELKKGYTTTETFTITFTGAEWEVEGTISGLQPPATTGEAYHTYERELAFTITDPQGTARVGDTFIVDTDSGIEEVDVGGLPLDLKATRDGALIAALVLDELTARPVIRWFDPDARVVVTDVTLAADAWPTRLAWTEDGSLLATDRDHLAVWEVPVGEATAIEHPTPWPTLDVASLDGEDRRRLYVVPLDGSGFWILDRDTDELLDVNAAVAGVQGMNLDGIVLGIEAIPRPYLTTEFTDDTLRVIDRTVQLTLADQRIVWAHEATGCLVQDNLGPTTVVNPNTLVDYATTFDRSDDGSPYLELSPASRRSVIVNACAGIAPAEAWEVRYDQNIQAWRVLGNRSGDQVALAYDDQRYLSDNGEISFTIRSGALPTANGATFLFSVDAGLPEVAGADIGLGSDPVFFEYRVGLEGAIGDLGGEGWYAQDIRPFTLVAGSSTNVVARVDPQEAQLEIGWN